MLISPDARFATLCPVPACRAAIHFSKIPALSAVRRGVRTAEFEQHSVAGGLDDPAAVFGNLRIEDALAYLPQPSERRALIALHVPAEADHVSDQDGREPAGYGTPVHRRLWDGQERRGQTVTQGQGWTRPRVGSSFESPDPSVPAVGGERPRLGLRRLRPVAGRRRSANKGHELAFGRRGGAVLQGAGRDRARRPRSVFALLVESQAKIARTSNTKPATAIIACTTMMPIGSACCFMW